MAVLDLGKVVPEKGVDYFTEQDINDIVSEVESEISVPTKTSDLVNDSGFVDNTVNNLTNYELKTNTGSSLLVSIDSSTYVMTMNLKNSAGTVISTQTVDLPLETMVIGASYDSLSKEIVLTLKNGTTTRFSVADLVSGLQTEITSTNKLSSDLVDDTNSSNKFVSASEKTTWNAKYDKPSGGIPSTDLSSAVQTSLGKADTAIQDISGKQDVLTAGTNITIDANNVISATGGGEEEVQALRSIAGANADTKFHYYAIDFNASGQPTLGSPTLKPAIINIMNDYIEHFDSNYTYNHIVIEIKTTIDNLDCTAKIENWGSSAQMNSSQAYIVYPGFYTREMLRFTYSDGICTDYTSTTTVFGTTNNTYPILKNNTYAYTPTSDYHPATKKYVDDAVASAGSSVPTITITASQIVSQNPLQISMTAEQQAIIEDVNIGTLIIDGSALGVTPAYCQKNEDGSTDVLFAAFSFAWNVTSGFNISNTAIFAGHYDKQTHILTVINTPLLGVTPTADNHLANKKYVDDAIAGVSGGSNLPIYVLNTSLNLYDNAGSPQILDNNATTEASKIINDAYTKGYSGITIILNSTASGRTYMFYSDIAINTSTSTITFYNCYGQTDYALDLKRISTKKLNFNGMWSNGVYTAGTVVYSYTNALLLTANNTQSYTVSNNYTPAHKKYVDDSITAAIGNALGGSY